MPAAAVLVLLAIRLSADPAPGVTGSQAPFTDEGWNLISARNLAAFGHPIIGDWSLFYVNLPFSLAEAFAFRLFGLGMVPGRLVPMLATAGTVAAVGWFVAQRHGRWPGAISAAALGGCELVLYYGGLAFLEPVVTLFLVAGFIALHRPGRSSPWSAALAGVLLALAIGVKPNAIFPVAGLLIAGGLVSRYEPERRLRYLIAAGVVTGLGLGWLVLVALPRWNLIGAALRIWPPFSAPADLGGLATRLVRFFTESDRALPDVLPLLVLAAAGVAYVWRARRLSPPDRELFASLLGWLALGIFVLVLVDYRPNRYAVPMLPALALLGAFGVGPVLARLRPAAGLHALAIGALLALVLLPGLTRYGGWLAQDTHRLEAIQARTTAALASRGGSVSGKFSPLFALRSGVPAYVQREADRINPGNLYRTRGVRWVVLDAAGPPLWLRRTERVAWDRRTIVFCDWWGGEKTCLIGLP
ncbi:MAG: ArnT family glycosyltransferase [Candidatus Limnocylindria bacterium]